MKRGMVAIAALLMLTSGVAIAQQSSGGDTKRRTIAVTYPDRGRHRVEFVGTTRGPRGNGAAEVRRIRGLTQVEIELDDMVPPYVLGADYTTYVMWAITPEGQIENLGEFTMNGSRSKLRATTRFDTLSLIITAEPHFAVQKPSRLVVLENVPPRGPVAVQTAEIFFTGDSGEYLSDRQLPEPVTRDWAKQPVHLLGARRAVQIAELAGAEQFAKQDLAAARESLAKAEGDYLAGQRDSADHFGRQAIREAERARELAEERAEAKRRRDEMRMRDEALARRESDIANYLERIDDLEAQLKVSEGSRRRAEEEAERTHEEAADLRQRNRMLQSQLDELSSQVRQLEGEMGMLRRRMESDRIATERQQAYTSLNQMLAPLATIQQDPRGFKVILPDALFVSGKGALKNTAAAKLNPIVGVLLGQQSVEFLIDGYMDDRGAPDAITQTSQERAQAIADFFTNAGIAPTRFKVTGYGSANPITSNRNLRGRTANRRVELVFLKP